jgi:hypothetical protein
MLFNLTNELIFESKEYPGIVKETGPFFGDIYDPAFRTYPKEVEQGFSSLESK